MRRAMVAALGLSLIASIVSAPAYAQAALRTWVSTTGIDDVNGICDWTDPCRTFAFAYTKTAAQGEIDALNAGDFGPITISKAITIDGHGFGGITVSTGNAVSVIAGNDDQVALRNLVINGSTTAGVGVELYNGKLLMVENCQIFGFMSEGILVDPATAGGAQTLAVINSTISTNIRSVGFAAGIRTRGGVTTVSHSVIVANGLGLIAESPGVLNADSNILTRNTIAVYSSGPAVPSVPSAIVRISNNDVYANLTGFGCGGGVLASNGTNRKGNNTGGTPAACSPDATITIQ